MLFLHSILQCFFVLVRGSNWEMSSRAVLAICKKKCRINVQDFGTTRDVKDGYLVEIILGD